jgi:2TM domain
MDNDPSPTLEQRARRRVGLKMGFYTHALVFVLVNAGLYLIANVFEFPRWGQRHAMPWNIFPLWGWGIGLAIHGVVTFIALQGEGMKDRMLQREIEALKKRDGA